MMQLMQTLQLLPENTIFPLHHDQMCAQTQSLYGEWSKIRNITCYNWCKRYKYKWRIPVRQIQKCHSERKRRISCAGLRDSSLSLRM